MTDDTISDGGRERDSSPLDELAMQSQAETTVSNRQLLSRFLDNYIAAPVRILWSDWRARIGSMIVLLYVLMGTVGVYIMGHPSANAGPRYVRPFETMEYPLGTDTFGEGLLAQTVHATPAMLEMIIAGAVFATVLATILGSVAGFKAGSVDRAIMTLADVGMTIPGLPLVIVLATMIEPSEPYLVGLVLAIDNWPGLTRAVRSQVLSVREENFVESSRAMGLSTPTIIKNDIVPDIMPYVSVHFVMAARGIIFESVGLYFLGILPFTNLNWGVTLNLAYTTSGALYTWETAHWLFVPMFTIVLISLGFILLSQGLDRVFNPRIRARHVKSVVKDETDEQTDEVSPMADVGGK